MATTPHRTSIPTSSGIRRSGDHDPLVAPRSARRDDIKQVAVKAIMARSVRKRRPAAGSQSSRQARSLRPTAADYAHVERSAGYVARHSSSVQRIPMSPRCGATA